MYVICMYVDCRRPYISGIVLTVESIVGIWHYIWQTQLPLEQHGNSTQNSSKINFIYIIFFVLKYHRSI